MTNFIKTKLDAVKRMLRHINETPVATLDEDILDINSDAATALTCLEEATGEVQEEGIYTNSETMILPPNTDGQIKLPENCLSVTATNSDEYRNLGERGGLLYDLDNNTYKFDRSVNVIVRTCLEFEELPFAAKRYITMVATINLIINTQGDGARQPYTENQLRNARAALDTAVTTNSSPNMLEDCEIDMRRFRSRRTGSRT